MREISYNFDKRSRLTTAIYSCQKSHRSYLIVAETELTGPCTLRPIYFFIFPTKTEKGQLLILTMFAYFKVQKKREKKKMVRKIDHFFIFLILKLNSKIQKILLTAKSDILLFLFS